MTLGDGKRNMSREKGQSLLKQKNGSSKLIHEVNYIPGLAQNLVIVGQLIKKGLYG